ncbi:uncharacterized protein LOC114871171 isoform X2 [Osmia bicornis bicornis]|uniref:uncharacterized protein LOC114871171 isoform X2 n=1 Tax=Osmia bicornis bicornis TaxID=1437191 RepID=UPI001EAE9F95|nr:uncharacterized protein LOC114871171 isoform X2 [Osmia bicornis bicornis]
MQYRIPSDVRIKKKRTKSRMYIVLKAMTRKLTLCFLKAEVETKTRKILVASAAVKIPTKTPWTSSASKSVYSRAIGPPMGMDTITVPYMGKSPFFPKFVDPKMMISKKTDLLSNLFGGLGPAYPPGFKPYMPYGASGPSLYSAADATQMFNAMSKNSADEGNGPYKRGIFGPFSAKPFSPMGSKFGPMSKYSGFNTIPDYSMENEFSRKRRSIDESPVAKLRSIMDAGIPETKNFGPPPPYPTLAPISEEPEDEVNVLLKKMGGGTAPKQYLPGMFGPFGPVVDPSMFMAKKSAFLDTLFKNLATSTTPSPADMVTATSTEKSTIVPPDFWFPTSIIPTPTEYNDKVEQFLDKLFETLKINKTAASSEDESAFKNDFTRSATFDEDIVQSKIARSAEDLSSINAAKDTIVDTILAELGDLKSNMVTTMNDLISYEKTASPTSSKKPFKSFGPGMWPGMKPAPNGMLPFQQKMAILSRVFDMLTDLQKNITSAIQNVVKAKISSVAPQGSGTYPSMLNDFTTPVNISLLDAIKQRLDSLDYGMPMAYNPSFSQFESKMARSLSKGPSSFWGSYPEDSANIKRQVDSDTESLISKNANFDQKQQARSVKMQMHQGYQSLPAGAIESVQAGGGSVPGHQGGGIKLFIQMPALPNMLVPGFQNNNYEN